jgi:hypothetical protein
MPRPALGQARRCLLTFNGRRETPHFWLRTPLLSLSSPLSSTPLLRTILFLYAALDLPPTAPPSSINPPLFFYLSYRSLVLEKWRHPRLYPVLPFHPTLILPQHIQPVISQPSPAPLISPFLDRINLMLRVSQARPPHPRSI